MIRENFCYNILFIVRYFSTNNLRFLKITTVYKNIKDTYVIFCIVLPYYFICFVKACDRSYFKNKKNKSTIYISPIYFKAL